MKKDINIIIEAEGVAIDISGKTIKVEGPKGFIQKDFFYPSIELKKIDQGISMGMKKASKKDKRMIGTFKAHLRNMITGVKYGFAYKMKICSSHFPMNVDIAGNEVIIRNFLGEKTPRKAKILDGVSTKIDGDVILISGANKESVGQTCANIETAVRIRKKDRRVFQDGIYLMRPEK